jgi:hypothetical protein
LHHGGSCFACSASEARETARETFLIQQLEKGAPSAQFYFKIDQFSTSRCSAVGNHGFAFQEISHFLIFEEISSPHCRFAIALLISTTTS